MVILLIAGLTEMISLYQMSYYPEPDSQRRNITKVEFGLPKNEKVCSRLGNRC